MQRRILAFTLAFLLLGMQHGAQWHALDHFGDWLAQPHEQGWQAPQYSDACAICALFAGGATAAVSKALAQPKPIAGLELARGPVRSLTVAAPSYYQSRAPPVLL
jgi:hypothetical protein